MYGYHGVSMREIAAAAGLSKPGLYHHVASKEDLLLAVLDSGLTELIPGIERLKDRTRSWEQRLTAWIAEILRLRPEQACIIKIGKELIHIDEKRRTEFSSRYHLQFIQPLLDFFLEGEHHGFVAQGSAGIGLWALLGMLTAFLEGEGGAKALGLETETLAQQLKNILHYGIATRV